VVRTPSRTATALGGGNTRHSADRGRCSGYLFGAARECGEEAVSKALARGTRSAYEAVDVWVRVRRDPKPNSHPETRLYMRRVYGAKVTRLTPGGLPVCPGVPWAREAARSTRDRQKSAESITRLRRARKEEHVESMRSVVFDA
jgi:hypothetical protein